MKKLPIILALAIGPLGGCGEPLDGAIDDSISQASAALTQCTPRLNDHQPNPSQTGAPASMCHFSAGEKRFTSSFSTRRAR